MYIVFFLFDTLRGVRKTSPCSSVVAIASCGMHHCKIFLGQLIVFNDSSLWGVCTLGFYDLWKVKILRCKRF